MHIAPNRKRFTLTAKDFTFHAFSGTGKGGSNRNKHQNCFRCVHEASGATGTAQDERDAPQNKKLAMQRCTSSPRFKMWAEQTLRAIEDGQTIEEKVDVEMRPENLKVQVKDATGRWVDEGSVKEETA